MNKRSFNIKLNKLKDEYPEKLVMIESIQRAFNRDVECIDKDNLRALYQNPAQFMMKIPTEDGEWTTMLHKWADNGLEDLLNINPIYLIAKNSLGDTVLMNLIQYALGETTEQINYDLLKTILSKPLIYEYKTGNDDETMKGCVWEECDISGKTPIDYLKDMATGKGSCENCMPITELIPLIQEWSNLRMNMQTDDAEKAIDYSDDADDFCDSDCDDENCDYDDCDDYPDSFDDDGVTASDVIDVALSDSDEEILSEDDKARADKMVDEQISSSTELNDMDIFDGIK